MFVFSKILTHILLPPGCILIALTAGILLLVAKKRKGATILICLTTTAFFLLSFQPFASMILRPLEDAHAPLPPTEVLDPADFAQYQLIVVLGGGSIARSPEAGSKAVLVDSGLKRAEYGLALAKKLGLPLLYSAGIVYEQEGAEPESEAARRFWLSLGIKDSMILVENSSRNTYENAELTKKLARGKKILLVTSACHMPRSVQSFRKKGVEVRPAPTDYRATRIPFVWAEYFPSIDAFQNSYRALHEYVGMAYYALLK